MNCHKTSDDLMTGAQLDLGGVTTPITLGVHGFDGTITLTLVQRTAFVVIAAMEAARERQGVVDDLDVLRCRLARSTKQDFGGYWDVSQQSAIVLEAHGLVAVHPRRLGGIWIYNHAVLTEKGKALAAMWACDVTKVPFGTAARAACDTPEKSHAPA